MNNYLQSQIQTLLNSHTYSHGALEAWCDSFTKQIVYNDQQLQNIIKNIHSFFKNVHSQCKPKVLLLSRLHMFLDVMFFNISSNFERCRKMLEDALLQSTDTGQFDQESLIDRMKVADHNITNVLSILINSEEFCNIVTSFCELEMHMVVPLTSLVQTVEYLIRKYQIQAQKFERAKTKCTTLMLPSFKDPERKDLAICNELLFTSKPEMLFRLVQIDSLQTQDTHFAILRLLEANWVKARKDRKLFTDCQNSGSRTFELLLEKLLIKNSKQDIIFSEKHSVTIQYKFIHNFLIFRFAPIFFQFSDIFNKLSPYETQLSFYKQNVPVLKQLSNFIKGLAETKFSNFLHRVSKVLSKKFSIEEVIELIKMLVLNRFLLNPELKALYDRHNLQPKTYALTANRIRSLFFPSKLQTLPKQVIELSNQLTKDYAALLRDHSIAAEQKRHVFVSDRLLFQDYEHLKKVLNKYQNQLEFPSCEKQRAPVSFGQFDTPALSTVQKIQPLPDSSSVKVIMNHLHTFDSKDTGNTDRLPESKRNFQRSEQLLQPPTRRDENLNTHNIEQESESEQNLSEIQVVEYLQVLRLEQQEKSKHRQSFIDSQRQYKQRFNNQFSKVSERLNSKLRQISQTRTSYELYVSSIL